MVIDGEVAFASALASNQSLISVDYDCYTSHGLMALMQALTVRCSSLPLFVPCGNAFSRCFFATFGMCDHLSP
jgi:hypothetical protein